MTSRPQDRHLGRTPLLLIGGAVLLMAGNIVHPIDTDPTAVSRFEFASEPLWIPIHLTLALGVLLLTAGVVAVSRWMQSTRVSSSANFAATAAMVGGVMLVAVFGALDGFAVSALATSTAGAEAIGAAAVAEEAIDSGLAAMGTLAFFGLAVGALGLAILKGGELRRWIGWAAVVLGVGGTVAGTALLAEGPTTFTINVMLRPAAVGGTLWFIALGVALHRLGAHHPTGLGAMEDAEASAP